MEKQQPEMNNSYKDKMVHQLPSTFIAQFCSVLLVVANMGMIGKIDVRSKLLSPRQISHSHGFYFSRTIFTLFIMQCGFAVNR